MTDDDLRRYLGAVDDPTGEVPADFRDRLLAELVPVVARDVRVPVDDLPLAPREGASADAVSHRSAAGWLVAAAVVVIAGLGMWRLQATAPDTATDPATTTEASSTTTSTTYTPVPTSLATSLQEACVRFLDRTELFPAGTAPAVDAAVIARYREDVALLRADLEQFPDAFAEVASLLVTIDGALAEAERAWAAGDTDGADASVDLAQGTLSRLAGRLTLPAGEPCLP